MQMTSRPMSDSVCLDSGFRKRAEGILYLSSSNGHLKNNWNAEGVPLRAEGALLCRDLHPPPIRRADKRNAPKGAQKLISR